jgi:transposase-like protein
MRILKIAGIKDEEIGMDAKPGRPKIGKKPRKAELRRLYAREGKSIREIAGQLGLHPDTIHYWLKKYGIKTRSMVKRSKLRKYKRSTLEKGIKEYGIRAYAKQLGVHENTLRNYLKSIKED